MRISQQGINFIKSFESLRLQAYDDATGRAVPAGRRAIGTLTIGYGHTGSDVYPGQTITAAQADALLLSDLAQAESTVNTFVRVPVTQQMFDAMVSLAYNWGGFSQSEFLKRLNSGNYQGAAQRMSEWPVTGRVGGQSVQMPGLVRRRQAEAALFISGGTPTGNPLKPPVTTPGAKISRMIQRLFRR